MSSETSSAGHPKSLTVRNVSVAFTVLVIVVAGLSIGLRIRESGGESLVSTPIVVNRTLLNGSITVNPGFWYLQFIVPSGAFDIQVSGNFKLFGENSIRVYIMNETSFNYWTPGQSVPSVGTYYDSGQVNTGNITATLPQGALYYLVYDNSFQTSQKIVNTQVTLIYLII